MNVSTMRRVDRWLGVPMCFVLSVLRRVGGLFARKPPEETQRIVFVKLAEQGSTVLAYPAIRRAVDRLGAENVYFLVFEPNRFILDVMEVIPPENVIGIRSDSILAALRTSLGAVRRMRKLHIDAAVDMEFFARSSAIFTYLSGASRRVGFHSYAGEGPYRGSLMTHPLVYNPYIHTALAFRLLVEALDHPAERLPAIELTAPRLDELPLPSLRAGDEELEEVGALIRQVTGREDVPPLLLLNANCSDLLPLRRWADENYVELARRLLDEYPEMVVAFTGAPSEAPPVAELVKRVGNDRCVSFAGMTTLRQLLLVYSLAEVLVTNDSGPAHFATLTPIDVITLFGPETPKLFSAPTRRSHVLWAATICSPCVSAFNNRLSRCKDNVCMQLIAVDDVFDKVTQVYERRVREIIPRRRRVRAAPAQPAETPTLADPPVEVAGELSPD